MVETRFIIQEVSGILWVHEYIYAHVHVGTFVNMYVWTLEVGIGCLKAQG